MMADRQVTQSRKDQNGDILDLCKPGQPWSPRSKRDAISDIESGRHRYFVGRPGGVRAYIHVVNGPTGKYLRTAPDPNNRNNLDDLPDC